MFSFRSRRVRTLYACLGENDGELSFEPNQIITNGMSGHFLYDDLVVSFLLILIAFLPFAVRSSLEPGWLEGTLNGKSGLVPENYVEVLPWPKLSPRLGSGSQSGSHSGFRRGSGSSSPGTNRTSSAIPAQCSSSTSSSPSKTLSSGVGLRSIVQGGSNITTSNRPSKTFIGSRQNSNVGVKSETKAVPPSHSSFQAGSQAGRSHCGTAPRQSSSDQARKKLHH